MVDDDHNGLRYVLKDLKTGRVYLVVLFTLLREKEGPTQEDVAQEGVD
jgi:hypothetical protein